MKPIPKPVPAELAVAMMSHGWIPQDLDNAIRESARRRDGQAMRDATLNARHSSKAAATLANAAALRNGLDGRLPSRSPARQLNRMLEEL